jgi:hypothetical protein
METMESTNILLKSPMPRNRHREEKGVETGVVEAFSDIAARRNDYPRTVLCLCEFLEQSGTLLRAIPPFRTNTRSTRLRIPA